MNMKIFNNPIVQILLAVIQIYVGLGFLEIAPGFSESGTLGKIGGFIFLVAGTATIIATLIKLKQNKES